MNEPVVAVMPVLGVEPGHVAEARRALAEQGRIVDDDAAIIRLLWAARALPVCLDALLSSSDRGRDAILGAPSIVVADDGGGHHHHQQHHAHGAPLVAIARIDDDDDDKLAVVVEIFDGKALFDAEADDAVPCCTVTIPLTRADAVDDVALHRFTVGPP